MGSKYNAQCMQIFFFKFNFLLFRKIFEFIKIDISDKGRKSNVPKHENCKMAAQEIRDKL